MMSFIDNYKIGNKVLYYFFIVFMRQGLDRSNLNPFLQVALSIARNNAMFYIIL